MDLYFLSNSAVLEQIGGKIRELRIELNMTQVNLATAAGVSVSTVKEAENGGGVSLLKLIQILRALRRFDMLDLFFALKPISPIALAKAQKEDKPRKRVRK